MSENYSFDLRNGWSQVDKSIDGSKDAKLLERNRAYGEVMALQALIDAFGLVEKC